MKPAIALDSILQAYEARNLLGGHNFLTYTLSSHCARVTSFTLLSQPGSTIDVVYYVFVSVQSEQGGGNKI